MWIGYFGFRRRALSESGVLGAIIIGTTIFGFGGWAWGTLLVVFFVSSSALSHFKESLKASLAEKFSKGHERDLAQALANGGAGALIALCSVIWPDPILGPRPILWAAFVGALATVNADTWATELGVLSKAKPRLVTNGHPVEVGTSGAITLVGTLAALIGSTLIAILGAVVAGQWALERAFQFMQRYPLFDPCQPACLIQFGFFPVLYAGTVSGLLGSLFDSFLGATVQAMYFCDRCGKETERYPTHTCGNRTRQLRGWRWLDNDWVNFLSSVVGAAVAAGLWLWLA